MQNVYAYAPQRASETALWGSMLGMRCPKAEIDVGQWLIGQMDVASANRGKPDEPALATQIIETMDRPLG
jgi:hypothetical protein